MDIATALNKFRSLKILVIGDVMLDEYLSGSINRLSPEAPVPVVSIEKKEYCLGGAANVAVNIKSLGADVLICCLTGNDFAGGEIRNLLKRYDLSVRDTYALDSRKTTVKTRVLSQGKYLLRYDSEQTDDLCSSDEDFYLDKIQSLLKDEEPDAVIFEDYNKGVLTEKIITETIAACGALKIFTSVDPKKKNFFNYRNADLFKPNLREIREALNMEQALADEAQLMNAHQMLHSRLQHRFTMITLGDHGIFFSDGVTSGIRPAHRREVADVSGAGDTVIAVSTLALVAGMDLQDAAEIANLAGGLVCEHAGVVPVTAEMLRSELL